MSARPWETHPALARVASRYWSELLRMIETPLSSAHIAAHCGTTAETVQEIREAKRAAIAKARYKRTAARDKARRQAEREGKTKAPWVPRTKPCRCGTDGCMVVQRPGQKPGDFNRQTYASLRCSNAARAKKPASKPARALREPVGGAWTEHPILSTLTAQQRKRLIEMAPTSIPSAKAAERLRIPVAIVETVRRARTTERAKWLKRAWWERQRSAEAPLADVLEPARQTQAVTKAIASFATGSPDLFLRRLQLTHPRGQGEPTRETLHEWAAMHSGKREWGTADVARLRAPTLVRNSIAGDIAA